MAAAAAAAVAAAEAELMTAALPLKSNEEPVGVLGALRNSELRLGVETAAVRSRPAPCYPPVPACLCVCVCLCAVLPVASLCYRVPLQPGVGGLPLCGAADALWVCCPNVPAFAAAELTLQPAACRLPPAACRLPPAACRPQPAACRMPPAACRLPADALLTRC